MRPPYLKSRDLLTCFAYLAFALVYAVSSPAASLEPSDYTLDPAGSIYGFPYGTAERELVEKLGEPTGAYSPGEGRLYLIYGSSHVFLFQDKKLVGLRIGHVVIDSFLFNMQPAVEERIPADEWRLPNGVCCGMSLDRARELSGQGLKVEGSSGYLAEGASEIWFDLSSGRYTENGVATERTEIHGIAIMQNGRKTEWSASSRRGIDRDKLSFGFYATAEAKGFRVSGIQKNGPADRSGIQIGDLITAVDGLPLAGMKGAEVMELIAKVKKAKLTIVSEDGSSREIELQKVRQGEFLGVHGVPLSSLRRSPRRAAADSAAVLGVTAVIVGMDAPPITARTLDDRPFRTDVLKGKPFLLNFTDPALRACDVQIPFLKTAYKDFTDEQLQIVTVLVGVHRARAERFREQYSPPWILLREGQERESIKAWGVAGLPANVLVSADGKVLAKNIPALDLFDTINSLLRQKAQ